MATKLSTSDLAGFVQILVDSDPSAGAGTPGPQGAIAYVNGSNQRWIKSGPQDTAWNVYTTTGQSISLSATADIPLVSREVIPVRFGTPDNIDTNVFAFEGGNSDIEVLAGGTFLAIGQFSVMYVSGGDDNSESKTRGYLYYDDQNGGAGPYLSVGGTRAWGYHRNLSTGNDTLTLCRQFSVAEGTFLRYAVEFMIGDAALSLDGDGCSMVIRRLGP